MRPVCIIRSASAPLRWREPEVAPALAVRPVAEAVMDQAYASPVKGEERHSRLERVSGAWRTRYEGSAAQDLARRLGALDFVNWILIFGATLLLTVLPII